MNSRTASVAKVNIRALVLIVAITIGVAALYYALCMINPSLAKSAAGGQLFGVTIRFANVLRGMALVSPGGAAGVAIGAWFFNVATGTATTSLGYILLPVAHLVGGLTAYNLSKKFGSKPVSDLMILAIYGAFMGIIVSMHLSTVAMLFNNEAWSGLFTIAALSKIASNIVITMAGYPFVLTMRKVFSNGEDSPTQ